MNLLNLRIVQHKVGILCFAGKHMIPHPSVQAKNETLKLGILDYRLAAGSAHRDTSSCLRP